MPAKSWSSRKIPVYLKDVGSKISDMTCRDRFKWRRMHKEMQEKLKKSPSIPSINISSLKDENRKKEASTQITSHRISRSIKVNQKPAPPDNGPRVAPIKAVIEGISAFKQWSKPKKEDFTQSYSKRVSSSMIEKAPLMSSYVYEEDSYK